MSGNVVQITTANWQTEVAASATPVVVDFWAEWCGPCRMLGPVVEELATEMAGKVKFGKCNVDENQDVAGKYGVRSIPTLLVFMNGVVKGQMVGAMTKAMLKERLAGYL